MIRFTQYIWLYALISAFVLVPGVYSLARFGLRPSVDFTGGTLLELATVSSVTQNDMEEIAREVKMPVLSVQKTGGSVFLFRMGETTDDKVNAFVTAIEAKAEKKLEILKNDTVGPVLGKELLFKSVIASVIAVIAILTYVAFAFKNVKNGVSAVIALIHDVLVVFGSFSLFGHFFGVEVDTLFLTAFLTTMSFSVHDTIVIFDRIREYRKKSPKAPFADVIDVALTETMGRSITNSFTIIFMLLALVFMGGETVRWFAVALLIGTITGTYSSPFVATPILLLWNRLEEKREQK